MDGPLLISADTIIFTEKQKSKENINNQTGTQATLTTYTCQQYFGLGSEEENYLLYRRNDCRKEHKFLDRIGVH